MLNKHNLLAASYIHLETTAVWNYAQRQAKTIVLILERFTEKVIRYKQKFIDLFSKNLHA